MKHASMKNCCLNTHNTYIYTHIYTYTYIYTNSNTRLVQTSDNSTCQNKSVTEQEIGNNKRKN